MPEDKTFYERLKDRWQNNKAIAIAVFAVVVLLAGLSTYEKLAKVVFGLTDDSDRIAAFNDNVQPIYFEGRSPRLIGDDCSPIDRIADAITEISPRQIIIRSHTSKVNVGRNRDLTLERGTLIANELHARTGSLFGGKIVVISYGGLATDEAEGEYRERVEVFASNAADVLVGEVIIADDIPAPWQRAPSPDATAGPPSPCLVTAQM